MTGRYARGAAAVLLGLAAAACGGASRGAAQAGQGHGHAPPADTAGYTEADVRFMTEMIGHHAQAIEMARLAPARAATPAIKTLAARIINAQQDEIAAMQLWLRDRGHPAPEPGAAAHHAHGGRDAPAMRGMLTAAQMRQLEEASGAEFDRLFLTFMIQHHRGAVAMVEELFGTYGAGQDQTVFKLASDVNVDQITEIERMRRMLGELIAGPRP